MPGHAKAGKKGEVDPDPLPYLVVSMEQKREDQMKPYDAKKSYWVPDLGPAGGYVEAILQEDDGKEAKVLIKGYEVSKIFCQFLVLIQAISDTKTSLKEGN